MPNPIWNETLEIGIPSIDRQHQQLVEQMTLLVDAMRENRANEEIANIIQFLDRYISQHFSFEEHCMATYCCPIACQNQDAHRQFVQTFQQIKTQFDREGSSLSLVLQVNQSLLDWFINHIRKIDTQLARSMTCPVNYSQLPTKTNAPQ
ncbi:MAG: hemerythrin family protein [Cyanobacteria bacterium SID2]|nr:hemerythrin family protein [Cyanobacteria bacterium SID2]MBP0002385.1 hemerythrin family protein [Cyanobacteria bacterium SBC]